MASDPVRKIHNLSVLQILNLYNLNNTRSVTYQACNYHEDTQETLTWTKWIDDFKNKKLMLIRSDLTRMG